MTSSERDLEALRLRRSGLTPGTIAEQLGVGTTASVNAMVSRALAATGGSNSIAEVRALELDRLDRLLQGVWVRAARGDIAALDRVIALSTLRLRLAGAPADQRRMRAAFDASLAEVKTTPADQALIEAGRLICDQIDSAGASGDPVGLQKAMYLIPHLVNVLRDLGATPAVRDAVTGEVRSPEVRENELAEFKRKRRLAAQGD